MTWSLDVRGRNINDFENWGMDDRRFTLHHQNNKLGNIFSVQ